MSEVYFASANMKALNAESSLPAKFKRLLNKYSLKDMFEGKTVAIKMHLGGNLGYTTIPPLFVKILVDCVKEAGGKPFITDGSGAVPSAKDRGYTKEVVGADIVPAAGLNEKYYTTVTVDYLGLKEVYICGEIANADAMIVYSHGKGHGHCGWGGAIKNIAMGNVITKSRRAIHALIDTEFDWNSELCTHCYLCKDNCPSNAISFNNNGEMSIFMHHCRYCMHCVTACPQEAVKINEEGIRQFQTGMAKVTKACLDLFNENSVLYVNHILNVTPFCDCWGFSSPAIVPDIGICCSKDIVAIEQASIDMVKTENYIDGSLPKPLVVRDVEGHLFYKLHGKDPYLQVEEAEKEGLGSREYKLIEVD
ncbi:MAG: DUF362 domain-containing protein [Armatimonadota bacterium]